MLLFAVKAPVFKGLKREVVQVTATRRYDVCGITSRIFFRRRTERAHHERFTLGPSMMTSRHEVFEVDIVSFKTLVLCIEK